MRTVNRAPTTFNIPDIDYQYFNHSNWKGINTNKNYYDLDPETFESANNVYVDEKGVLKSRPALHLLADNGLSNIEKSWSFNTVQVYLTSDENGYKLNFVNDGNICTESISDADINLLLLNDKIFIFAKDAFKYYDIVNRDVKNGIDYIYSPIRMTYTNGVGDEFEFKNILGGPERYRHLYSRSSTLDYDLIKNHNLVITVNDDYEYTANYSGVADKAIVTKKSSLTGFEYPANYICDETYSDKFLNDFINWHGNYAISFADNGTMIACKRIENGDKFYYEIYYSVDGLKFNLLYFTESTTNTYRIHTVPKISKNGKFVYYVSTDGIIIRNLFLDEYTVYTEWTKINNGDKIDVDNDGVVDSTINIVPPDEYNYLVEAELIDDGTYVLYFVDKDVTSNIVKAHIFSKRNNSIYANYTVTYTLLTSSNNYQHFKLFSIRPKIFARKFVYINAEHLSFDIYVACETSTNKVDPTNTQKWLIESSMAQHNQGFTTSTFTNSFLLSKNFIYTYYITSRYTFYRHQFTIDSYSLTNGVWSYVNDNIPTLGFHFKLSGDESKTNVINYDFNDFDIQFKPTVGDSLIASNQAYIDISNITEDFNVSSLVIKFSTNNSFNLDEVCFISDAHLYAIKNGDFYSNDLLYNEHITVDAILDQSYKYLTIKYVLIANNLYAFDKNKLFIGDVKYDYKHEYLYFSEDNAEKFSQNISKIHPLSTNQIAIFLPNEIWYTDITDNGTTLNKSKVALGCNFGDDVVTSYDGKYTIFPSKRGLVALSYQDFVASTEQTVTYLSDALLPEFISFRNNAPVKMFLYKYWLFCYHNTDGQIFIFDFRNNSWWRWSLPHSVLDVCEVDEEPEFIINKKRVGFNYTDTDYFDYLGDDKLLITWHLTSQKLSLGTLNNYKHVVNLVLNAIQESDDPMFLKLSLANYRDTATEIDGKVLEYQVDVLKTFVKRLNYYKINHFQYKLENTTNNVVQIPLSLDSISIKYKVTGQVR